MKELRDKRKNAGQIYYSRMEELRDNFDTCNIGEIILAAWDFEQYGIEYDFKNEAIEDYPELSKDKGMQIEYNNLLRDFKLNAEAYEKTCERRRANAVKRWKKEGVSIDDETIKEIAEAFKEQGIKTVRELEQYLESTGIHEPDKQAAIVEAFTKL